MAQETALDALNAALGDSVVTPPGETDEVIVDETADLGGDDSALPDLGDEAGGDKPEGEEGEAPEGEEGEASVVDADAPDLASEAKVLGVSNRRADGTFKTKEQFAADVAAAKALEAAKPGAKALVATKPGEKPGEQKPVAAKKPADPINDPIPADLKQETQQRIRTLIERTKESETKAAEVQQNFDYLVQGVQATGASPEQYGETLSWLSLFNSGDPKQQGQALEIIEGMADQLATMLGVDRKIADPLAAHLDLQQAVQKGQLTAQYAKEMARQRNAGAFRQKITTEQNTYQQQATAAAQEKESARVELNTLEESLRASDPDYDRKKAVILPTIKTVFPLLKPAEWKQTFTRLYREARVQPRGAAPQRRTTVPQNQPLRGNRSATTSGGGTPLESGPKTAMDALNAALSRK